MLAPSPPPTFAPPPPADPPPRTFAPSSRLARPAVSPLTPQRPAARSVAARNFQRRRHAVAAGARVPAHARQPASLSHQTAQGIRLGAIGCAAHGGVVPVPRRNCSARVVVVDNVPWQAFLKRQSRLLLALPCCLLQTVKVSRPICWTPCRAATTAHVSQRRLRPVTRAIQGARSCTFVRWHCWSLFLA